MAFEVKYHDSPKSDISWMIYNDDRYVWSIHIKLCDQQRDCCSRNAPLLPVHNAQMAISFVIGHNVQYNLPFQALKIQQGQLLGQKTVQFDQRLKE